MKKILLFLLLCLIGCGEDKGESASSVTNLTQCEGGIQVGLPSDQFAGVIDAATNTGLEVASESVEESTSVTLAKQNQGLVILVERGVTVVGCGGTISSDNNQSTTTVESNDQAIEETVEQLKVEIESGKYSKLIIKK